MSPILFIVFMVLITLVIDGVFNGMGLFINLCMLGVKLTGNIIGMVLVISLILYSIF
jgi:hypothetical protein